MFHQFPTFHAPCRSHSMAISSHVQYLLFRYLNTDYLHIIRNNSCTVRSIFFNSGGDLQGAWRHATGIDIITFTFWYNYLATFPPYDHSFYMEMLFINDWDDLFVVQYSFVCVCILEFSFRSLYICNLHHLILNERSWVILNLETISSTVTISNINIGISHYKSRYQC